jgi:hypothetical protein
MIRADNTLSVIAGAVNLGTGGKLEATNEIVVAAGSVTLAGSGVSLPPSDNSHIASYGGMVTVGVTSNITLSNGAYIEGGTDVKLALNGSASMLTLNPVSGQTPSYIWAHSPNTIYLAFPLLASGGVMIDGRETIETLAGGSGLFVGTSMTPARDGFGLSLAYQQQVLDSNITKDLMRAISAINPEALTEEEGALKDDDPRRRSGYTAGGKDDEFGDEEGKDDKDKNGGSGGDKSRQKGKLRVATCRS